MVKRQAAAEPAAAGDSDRENAPSPEEPVKEGEKAGGAEKAEPVFEENEVVLARDSGKLYDAKVSELTSDDTKVAPAFVGS